MSSGQEILAQDEIDALIHGIGNGAVPTEAPPARDEARQYNFNHNTLTLLAEDIPMFRGMYGMSRGQQAVKVGDLIRRTRPGAVDKGAP
jgi:flagellar motor switch protein FliM